MADTTTPTLGGMPAEIKERIAEFAIRGPTTDLKLRRYAEGRRQHLAIDMDHLTFRMLLNVDSRFRVAIRSLFSRFALPGGSFEIQATSALPGILFELAKIGPGSGWGKNVRSIDMDVSHMNDLQRLRPYSEGLMAFSCLTTIVVVMEHSSPLYPAAPVAQLNFGFVYAVVQDMVAKTVGKWERKETLKNYVQDNHPYETLLSLTLTSSMPSSETVSVGISEEEVFLARRLMTAVAILWCCPESSREV